MSPEVCTPDPLRWRDLCAEAGATVFQSPQMAGYLDEIPGHRALAVGVEVGGRLAATILADTAKEKGLKGPFSARSVITGGPVIAPWASPREEVVSALLKGYEDSLPAGVIYTEVRNLEDRGQDRSAFEASGYSYEDHANFLVDLAPDPDEVMARIHPTKRRQIRKALKEGAEIVTDPTAEELQSLYSILQELYSRRVKKPLPPSEFLTKLHLLNSAEPSARVFVVRVADRVVGGIVCPITEGRTIYEWYVCGSRIAGSAHPSVLATWAPIEWGCLNGYAFFDFMGAGKPGEEYGVREFKRGFGGREVDFGRQRKVHKPLLMAVGRTGLGIMRRLG